MNVYKVGQIVERFKSHKEEVYFDISDEGATLVVLFPNPTKEEIEQFVSGKSFEFRFTELYGIIMIMAKIGNLNWIDAPYSPHLSRHLTYFQIPCENQGLGLTVIFADSATGEIKHIRLLGLSERFTKELFGVAMEHKMKPFDSNAYYESLRRIYSAYKTSEIVKMSKCYCKIN